MTQKQGGVSFFFFFWLLLSIQHVACNASHEGKDKTMGSTWSEILPAVAKQHPPPTSPSAPLVSWKNAHSTQLAGRKLINFSQDLPPCVRTHTHTPFLLLLSFLTHIHTQWRFLWMRAWEGVSACAVQCWYMHWAPELKIKITLNAVPLKVARLKWKWQV